MKDNRIVIHIGLHKTGTTYIQNEIFPRLKSLTVIRAWHNQRYLINSDFSKQVIITDEGISGDPWKGEYFKTFKKNIQHLKTLYKNPKIMFGIRRHDQFILSLYKQQLHQKGFNDLSELFNIENTGILKQEDLFLAEKIQILKQEFDDVFIYSQETLKETPQQFINALISFLNIDDTLEYNTIQSKPQNVGVKTVYQVETLKKLNKLSHKLERIKFLPSLYSKRFKKYKLTPRDLCQNRLKNRKSKTYTIDKELQEFILNYYKSDWETAKSYVSY
ncbi:hypothetical protein [Lacinutrix salivirga]